jgi:hypothetical protein
MKIEFELKDINGEDLQLGDLVWVYRQDYEEIGREEDEGGLCIEIDITKPRAITDVPLFIGKLVWQEDLYQLDLEVCEVVDDVYRNLGSISLGIGYALEKMKEGGEVSCPKKSSQEI